MNKASGGDGIPAAAAAKSLQSCLTLCDPIDSSPPGSPVPGILQARTLEWAAISFSNAWKWKVKVKALSRVWPSATPWTAAFQAPPSMGFSRQEYWSGVPLPSPGIPAELFQILKDDAIKELHSICQQIWKTQQWPQVSLHSNPKERQCQRTFKFPYNCTHFTCQQDYAQNSPSQASSNTWTVNFQMFKLV